MAISAETLNIILKAKDKDFARQMKQNEKRVQRFSKKSNASLKGTTARFSQLGMAASALLPALGVAAMISGVQRVVSNLDEIGKTADRIGITTDALQELRTVAESAGVAQGALDSSIEKLGKGLAEAAMGIGTAQYALDALGLSAGDLMALGLDGALAKIADEINKVPDPMQKTALATQLFGRSGAPMLNLLREGADGMAKMRKEARELGIVISEDLIRSAEAAQTELDLMSRVINANLSSALINLAPLIVSTSQGIAGLSVQASQFMGIYRQMFSGMPNSITDQMNLAADQVEIDATKSKIEGLSKARSELLNGRGFDELNLVDRGLVFLKQEQLQAAQGELEMLTFKMEDLRIEAEAAAKAASEIKAGEDAVANIQSLAAVTEGLKKQAELNSLSADDREREVIAVARLAKENAILLAMAASGEEITSKQREEVEKLGWQYETAALAASKILNPVKAAGGATKALKVAADGAELSFDELITTMVEASPALQRLGFDAEGLQNVMQTVEYSMENAFMGMVDGTLSAKDAFKSMAADIIKELYRVLVVQKLVGSFDKGGGGILGSIFSAFGGGGGGGGKASGGSVMAGQSYTVGEHGREPFVPAQNGRILSTAQAKSAISGGGGGGGGVTQNFYFSANGDDSVRRIIAQAAPQIANMAKSSMLDDRRRGGVTKAAFG